MLITFYTRIVAIISVCVLGSFAQGAFAVGVGISPAEIVLDHLNANSEVASQIHISRGNPSQDQEATVVMNGIAAPYIVGESTITLPKGQQITTYPFTVKTGSLATGTYEATITVLPIVPITSSDPATSGGARLIAGAQGVIRLVVTNKSVQEFEIKEVTIQETEEGSQLGFTYLLRNTGNVDSRPTKIDFSVVNRENSETVYTQTISGDTLKPVRAFTDEEVPVLTKADLKTGLYMAKLVFYNNDTVLFEVERAVQVFPAGTLAQDGILANLTTNKESYESGELVQFKAVFQNTGNVGLSAAPVIEVMKGDKLLDVLKPEPLFVLSGKTVVLETSFRPTESGAYRARGYVSFGPRHSNDSTVAFNVRPAHLVRIVGFILLLILFFGGAVLWFHHKKPPV